MIILDTNVVSELMATRPAAAVVAWADAQRRDQLVTTAITVMELYAGLQLLKAVRRRSELGGKIEWALDELLGGRILNFDRRAAVETAKWHAVRREQGRPVETRDAQIAGIALSRRVAVGTRNVAHFEGLDVKVINPWSGQA